MFAEGFEPYKQASRKRKGLAVASENTKGIFTSSLPGMVDEIQGLEGSIGVKRFLVNDVGHARHLGTLPSLKPPVVSAIVIVEESL